MQSQRLDLVERCDLLIEYGTICQGMIENPLLAFEFQIHGSKTSTDLDYMVFVEELPPTIEARHALCRDFDARMIQFGVEREPNSNLAVLKDGIVLDVFKGIPDECNNSMLATYDNHLQRWPLKISRRVERNVDMKLLRAARSLLTAWTRTQHRPQIKTALREGSLEKRIKALSVVNIEELKFTTKIESDLKAWASYVKLLAFQMGQSLALESGFELYTKHEIGSHFPEMIPHLSRDPSAQLSVLEKFRLKFVNVLENRDFKIKREELDLLKRKPKPQRTPRVQKKRKAISFDIDGTIVNIEKRMALAPGINGKRTKRDWDIVLSGANYHLDEPIDIARKFVKYCFDQGFQILYISGRRKVTTEDTRKWLEQYDYPNGEIFHRRSSFNSTEFKIHRLQERSRYYDIVAHIGDRLHDDALAATKTNIQPIIVLKNRWVTKELLESGLQGLIKFQFTHFDSSKDKKALQILRTSKFWSKPYKLIPQSFCTLVEESK